MDFNITAQMGRFFLFVPLFPPALRPSLRPPPTHPQETFLLNLERTDLFSWFNMGKSVSSSLMRVPFYSTLRQGTLFLQSPFFFLERISVSLISFSRTILSPPQVPLHQERTTPRSISTFALFFFPFFLGAASANMFFSPPNHASNFLIFHPYTRRWYTHRTRITTCALAYLQPPFPPLSNLDRII